MHQLFKSTAETAQFPSDVQNTSLLLLFFFFKLQLIVISEKGAGRGFDHPGADTSVRVRAERVHLHVSRSTCCAGPAKQGLSQRVASCLEAS